MKKGNQFAWEVSDFVFEDEPEKKEYGVRQADDREHTRLYKALTDQGMPEAQAHAVAYDIIESGKFDEARLPKGYSSDPIRALIEEMFGPKATEPRSYKNGHSRLTLSLK